jgi:hypothetical protein
MSRTRGFAPRSGKDTAARRLFEAERLFRDFKELTPFRFRPLAKSFATFTEYERWRRAQTSPWYR